MWKNKFILQKITDYLMLYNSNSQEKEDYAALLYDDNFENNFNDTIAKTKIKADPLYSGCVYSDINDKNQNPILKLLSAINNIKLETMPI